LEVAELLVPSPLSVMNASIAFLFRTLKDEQATVLFDEVDAIFNSKVGNYEDLRALLNTGYRRGAMVGRIVGEGKGMRPERFPVFAATALAAIGDLPDTVESRAIIVPMRRRAPDEDVAQFRRRRVEQEIGDVRARLEQWGAEHVDELGQGDPEMPEGLTDRAADIWEPLLAIADLAGGEWPARARQAATGWSRAGWPKMPASACACWPTSRLSWTARSACPAPTSAPRSTSSRSRGGAAGTTAKASANATWPNG
jgi:hypothetical protein